MMTTRITVLITLGLAFLSCGSSYYMKAVGFREQGEHQQGIEFFNEKLKSDSDALGMFDAHHVVLQYFEAIDRLDAGFELYEKFSDPALTNYIAGLKYQYLGQHFNATNAFNRALKSRPKEYIIWYGLADSLIKIGRYKEARRILARVYKLNDSFAPAIYDMGILYGYGRNEFLAGKSWLESAVDNYHPLEREARLDAKITMGLFSELAGDWKTANSIYESCSDEDFNQIIRSCDPGEAAYRVGKKARAEEIWARALDILGYQSSRGRYFFKKLYGSRQGVVDSSGIKLGYVTTESRNQNLPRIIYSSEFEPFFSTNWGAMHERLQKDELSNLHFGWEYWTVEHAGIMTRPQAVQNWIHTRGIIQKKTTKDGLDLFVSVHKAPVYVNLPNPDYPGHFKQGRFWNEGNPQVGVYKNGELLTKIQFNQITHLHRIEVIDVDGDGLDDLVATGFNYAGNLVLDVKIRPNGAWVSLPQLTCDLANLQNGFVLVDLDKKPGLELVIFSGQIAWADVYQLKPYGFEINNQLFTEFARDFYERYSFIDQQRINERLYSNLRTQDEKTRIQLLANYTYRAAQIIGARP